MCSTELRLLLLIALVHAAFAVGASRFRKRIDTDNSKAQSVDVGDTATGVKKEYPFYHTSAELLSEVTKLSEACDGMMTIDSAMDDQTGMTIDYVTVTAKDAKPSNRVFILFGEHSRELISPESGLHMLKMLCGAAPTTADLASVLENNEFQIVLNGNPKSREKVEDGDYCRRVNEHGVDLNRNWDEQWERGGSSDTNSGPRPFSEPETRIFRQLVMDYKPTTFLTVHSGTRGMYMPWAYDTTHLAKTNQPEMLSILQKLDEDHCQCPFGAAGKEVGYSCPGTCLDWVYDQLETPYAFAFEIYTSPALDDSLKQRWQTKVSEGGVSLIASGASLGHPHFRDLFMAHPSNFVQLNSTSTQQALDPVEDPKHCFEEFNPITESSYKEVIDNWANAYLEMAEKVVLDLESKKTSAAAETTLSTKEDASEKADSADADTLGVLGRLFH